jgi:hypothetical protein
MFGLRRGQRTLGPAPRIEGRSGRRLQERGSCSQAAARSRPPRRPLQIRGDVLVRPRCRLGGVPRAAIRIGLGIGGLGQRAVRAASLLDRCRPVDRRAHQRVPEPHPSADLEQPGRCRGRCCFRTDSELLGRAPHQHRITEWFCRRDQQQLPCPLRKRRQPLSVALLDPPRDRPRSRQPETARQLRRRQTLRQLQQRQRISPRLGDDPVEHPPIHWSG